MIETFLDVLINKVFLKHYLFRNVDPKLFCIGTEIGCLYSYGFKNGGTGGDGDPLIFGRSVDSIQNIWGR